MPSVSSKQRRFMQVELARKRAGKKTKTGMSEEQLQDFITKSLIKELKDITKSIKYGSLARVITQFDK